VGNRTGKLVKKSNEKVMNLLDMESYPWLHFNEQGIIFPDNVRRTVILEKMHDPLEYREKITNPKDFDVSFAQKSHPLLPTDMTEDFKRGQKEMAKRRRRNLMDEEEAMALELAEIESHELAKEAKEAKNNKKNANKKNEESKFAKFTPSSSIEKKESQKEEAPLEVLKQQDSVPQAVPVVDEKQIEEKWNQAKEDGFAKGQKEGFDKGEQEGKEEGFKKGFEDGSSNGYRSGEERGMVAAESKYERAFGNISEAAIRMDQLKVSLLQEGKDVFLELAKLCCERILREQIKGNDASLSKLFDEVIKSYSASTSLSIQMNPNDAERIRKHLDSLKESGRIQIKENLSLEAGSFQVESDTGVSLVDIKKNVDLIIQSIKSDLFKEQEDDVANDRKNKTADIKKAV
jgi:flagellar assembly protein FliH